MSSAIFYQLEICPPKDYLGHPYVPLFSAEVVFIGSTPDSKPVTFTPPHLLKSPTMSFPSYYRTLVYPTLSRWDPRGRTMGSKNVVTRSDLFKRVDVNPPFYLTESPVT